MIQQFFQQLSQIFTWIVIVAPWEQAIRVRRGTKIVLLGAGLYLRIPFIDRVYRQSTRRRITLLAPQTLTTRDGHTLTIGAAFGYVIINLAKVYYTLEDAEDTLMGIVGGEIARFVARSDMEQCKPGQIQEHLSATVKLGDFGLGEAQFYINNYARVRTYRMITGDVQAWRHKAGLQTYLQAHEKGS